MSSRSSLALVFLTVLVAVSLVQAAVVPERVTRFDSLVIYDPTSGLGQIGERPEDLPGYDAERAGWEAFRAAHGGGWRVHLDRRSGTPLLVDGRGIHWLPAGDLGSASELESMARRFIAENGELFQVRESELVFNEQGSGPFDDNHWVLLFNRQVGGIPVEEQRLRLYVTYGNLVAFGADHWGNIDRVPEIVFDEQAARDALYSYMELTSADTIEESEPARLVFVAGPSEGERERRYAGPVGQGTEFHLAWRLAVRVAGEPGIWVGKVDAVTGEIVAFYDDVKYAQVKGGVFPVSNDGDCPSGCEQPDYPMAYADIDIDGSGFDANDMGVFECTPSGGTATTNLAGPFLRISDNCGAVNESVTCDNDIDLSVSGGADCVVPSGSSAGNTHASRSCFYHANRIKEKGRSWLPNNTWLTQQLTCNVNINSNCNAFWNGTINFYTSGGGCGNTGEIGGVIHHEYGHGIDQMDGGGYDNPSEAYADVVAIIQERLSCVGRGFRPGQNCSGYGDTCLDCTGIREMDWDKRVSHTPATPANFIQPNCGGGSGACGREVHCESYPPSEAVFDLAFRDLPAMGLDSETSWQLTEKLFYVSREGSGGPIYTCSLPNSDGCAAGSWFMQMRNADDDDGNLDNGTPHAEALFAAFDRHAIACGAASDASNQNSSSCPTLDAPVLDGSAGSNSADLGWTSVTDAAEYVVLRTEVDCSNYTMNIVDTIPAPTTNYVDDDLANDFPLHFRVMARGSNSACESAVSNCVTVTPQPFAGTVRLDRAIYHCDGLIAITVRDANTGSTTLDITIFSDTETDPETVTLTETEPGTARFEGTIMGTSGPSTNGDGLLALSHGDTITANYIDADDGEGGTNLERETTASADCIGPVISDVDELGVTDVQATVTWSTDESSTSVVHWGETTPPGNTTSSPGLTNSHAVALTGLQQCTVYFYSVESSDNPGNVATDDNGGSYYHFETLGDFGQGLQPCHQGQITLEAPTVSCMDSLPIELIDIDLNVDSGVVDTVMVTVTSTTETTPEVVTLTETGPNTSTFAGSILTAPGPAVEGDGVLQTTHDDLLTATYQDADDGTGQSANDFDTGVADCVGAGFVSVRVTDITDESAVVRWTTSEPTTGEVDWGTTPSLGTIETSSGLSTSHQVTLALLPECERVYFRVTSTDQYGNVSVSDADGSPYEFNAYEIPGAVFKDGFESDTGWSLDSQWEIGGPQGLGSSPGDPTAAFSGSTVLGHDLSGQGEHSGDYEPRVTEYATSPVIDASTLANGQMKFRRWLNVGGGAISTIEVNQGGTWNEIWTSPSAQGQTASSWSLQTLDISQYADGNSSLQIRFKQFGGTSLSANRAGWNIDRFVVRDGSLPNFGTCGGCGGAPTFAGASSAVDIDPCGDSGVTLNWEVAPAWGTGGGGTFVVYRDTTPDFTPSSANLIASGVTGTSYTDTGAPNDVDLFYVVRAENDETCDTGPNNGGVVDGNLVYASARDDTSQPAPGDVGDSLRVDNVNDAHPRLSWADTVNAAKYHIYRGDSAQGPFNQIGEPSETFFEDQDELGNAIDRYYFVRAADTCGNEGP